MLAAAAFQNPVRRNVKMKKNTLSKKSIFAILIAAIIALMAFAPVSAYGGIVYVADETDSIPAEELAELNEYAEHASDTCGTDILFLLTENETAAGDSIVDYMVNYPDIGNGESRIFFAIGPDSWYILCGGNMQNMLTNEQEDALRDAYNGPETYFDGIKAYIDLAESYVFEIYPNDTPVDEGLERLPEEISSMDEFTCVLDGADMLEPEQRAELLKKLDELSSKYGMDYVVCTVKSLNDSTAEACADDIFDYCGFGLGEDRSGVLLLISTGDRQWHISTRGYGITVFTDAGIQYIGEELTGELKSADYAGAFFKFADLCDKFTEQAVNDRPYDVSNLPIKPLSFIFIPISLGIGLVIALIAVAVMKSKLKTVRYKSEANSYVRPGSMNITVSRDLFLYRTVSVSPLPKNNGGSDGGSSTHTSSSGATHGGGGGSF
ncbi:MAG TPA: hypothetical protein DCY17_00020 [Clostridiales bacterium]|nr:hypothetical protein [Clostridiales bacterium]